MARRKLTLLTIAALMLVSSLQIACGLPWVSVSMFPENASGSIELGTLAGSELLPAATALLPVLWLGVVVSLLLQSRIWLGYSLLAAIGAAGSALILNYMMTFDTSAAEGQLMSWRNVAAAHDVTDLAITRNSGEWIALVAALLVTLGFAGLATFSFRVRDSLQKLPKQTKTASTSGPYRETAAPVDEGDSISLWDSQRPAK